MTHDATRLIYGCMRLVGDGSADARRRGHAAVRAALDAGYRVFDHADIYSAGECERLFGELLAEAPSLREQLTLVSKCGIRMVDAQHPQAPKRYDFSKAYLVSSVEGSLRRLRTDTLDALLLHRPDYLGEVDEVAAAFAVLKREGKVRAFGVSNFTPAQVELLASVVDDPLSAHQVEINLQRLDALEDGTLEQCQRLRLQAQAWSPLRGVIAGEPSSQFSAEDKRRLDEELAGQAARYEVAPWQVALAFLLRHPARIAPIVGSTTPQRIADATRAEQLDYTREDWYRLLEARRGTRVP